MVRLFPDGKTVFVPSDGAPLAGYELARAEIESRGGAVIATTSGGGKASFGILSWLFGGGNGGGADDAEEGAGSQNASLKAAPVVVASSADAIAKAKHNLPRGETFMKAPDPVAAPPVADIAALDAKAAEIAAPADLRATAFIAPLPPRKPADLYVALALAGAPLPPVRPTEFALAQLVSAPPAGAPASKNDLIAALLIRGKLPGIITRGVSGSMPSSALSLVEIGAPPEPPERPAMLAKAAALNAPLPPLAPARANSASRAAPLAIVPRTAPGAGKGDPRDSGVTGSIASARPAPAVVVAAPPHANAKLAAPFGAMPVDAFRTASATGDRAAEAALHELGLRGAAN